MFNNGLKKEALSNLKKEKSIYDAQLSTTIITLEGFHNKKLEIKDKVKRFYDDVERIGGKPDFIKIELQKIDTELNKFDSALMAATGPVGWAVGGAALAISGFMANSKNKEIARKATEQIEKLKEETKKIKELTTKVNFERIELGKKE